MIDDTQNQDPKTYSEDYVRQLRDEAKKYRLQLRELQSSLKYPTDDDVQDSDDSTSTPSEPTNQTEPVSNGNSATVDAPQPQINQAAPQPISPAPVNVGVESKSVSQLLRERNVQELKEDPKARQKVREFYQMTLRSGRYSS